MTVHSEQFPVGHKVWCFEDHNGPCRPEPPTPRAETITFLKARWWTPGKIQRLLDEAESKGCNPLTLARAAVVAESIAHYRPLFADRERRTNRA